MPPAKPQRGDKLKLHIERLSVGGRGVGRAEDLVVFVPDTCPDEDVEIEITSAKKNFAEARVLTVTTPGPTRVTPPCPVAGICGGCNWQHVSYDGQLEQKRMLVRDSLRKFSGFDVSKDEAVQAVVASPRPLRYRNRVQFHHAGGKLGYYKRGSHDLVAIDDCPISEEPIAESIPSLRAKFAGQPPGRVEVFVDDQERVQTRVAGEPTEEDEGGLSFAFAQVNTQQNRNLISLVVSELMKRFMDEPPTEIFDLYAGSGNLTFPLKKAFPSARTTAVELNRESVERGRAKGPDIRWVQSDVGAFLRENAVGDVVVIDPPRAGCEAEVAQALAASNAKVFVYVSCHPVTLARDLKFFKDAGWKLESVQPLDMFPQTDHVETLAVLTKV